MRFKVESDRVLQASSLFAPSNQELAEELAVNGITCQLYVTLSLLSLRHTGGELGGERAFATLNAS
jgi:predicted transcriptional regulator